VKDVADDLTPLGTTGGPLTPIETHHRVRLAQIFAQFSLAEVQLLLLGLWIIGEENRVDPRLNTEYGWLLNALSANAQGTAGQMLNDQAPSPHPQPAKRKD
jgi:hypothetical protein